MTESPSSSPSTSSSPRPDSPRVPTDAGSGDHVQDRGDAGYNKSLKNRHLQMIAIGGSIGSPSAAPSARVFSWVPAAASKKAEPA